MLPREAVLFYSPAHNGASGKIIDASPAATALLGWKREQLLALAPEELVRAEEKVAFDEEGTFHGVFSTAGGRARRLEVHAHPLSLGGQSVIAWVLCRPDAEERAQDLQEAFSRLAYQLAAVSTPKEAAMAIIDAADELFGWDACHLNLYPREHDRTIAIITIDTVDGERVHFPPPPFVLPVSPMGMEVLEKGAKLILLDPADPRGRENLTAFGRTEQKSASLMYVPIRKGNQNFGVLSIQSYTMNKYCEDDLQSLQIMADHCSGALERILAEDKLRQQVFLTKQFAELGKQLSSAATPKETAMIILETAEQLFGWDACFLALYDEEEDVVRGVIAFDLVKGERTVVPLYGEAMKPGGFLRKIIEEGGQLVLRNETNPPLGNGAPSRLFGDVARRSQSMMYAPMRSGNKKVGIVSVQSYMPFAYTDENLQSFQALADHCSGALARALAEHQLRLGEERLRLLTSQIPSLLWTVDRELRFTLLLGGSAGEAGMHHDKLIGTSLRDFLETQEHTDGALERHEQALRDIPGTFEMVLNERNYHAYVEPFSDPLGKVIGCIGVAHDITLLKQAEADLRKFEMAIEQAPSLVVISNRNHVVEYVNPAFEAVTGFTRDEMVGSIRQFRDMGDDAEEFAETLKARMEAGAPFNTVVTNRKKNGELFYEGKTFTPLRNDVGEITHYVETGKDITDKLRSENALRAAHDELEARVRERTEELSLSNSQLLREVKERAFAEEELERSLSLLRATLESTTDGIMVVDLDGRLVSFNQKWLQMWQIPFTLVESFDAQELQERLGAQLKEPTSFGFLLGSEWERTGAESFHVLELKDGKIFESYSKSSMIGGKGVGRVWSFRDVTLRKRDEEALARSEAIYREAIENASGVPYRWMNDTQRYDFMGEGIRNLLGLDPYTISRFDLKRIIKDCIVIGHENLPILEYREKIRKGEIKEYRVDLLVETPLGETKWISDCSVPLRDGNTGELIGSLGILQDITERKRAEEERRLQQERLIQTEKLVALGTLVSGVAHEINNPNNFIMLNAPVLMDCWQCVRPLLDDYYEENGDFLVGGLNYSEMREEIPNLFHGLLNGANRIRSIVQELRDFSRPNPNTLKEPVDVNAVVKSALILMQNIVAKSTTNFSLHCGENLPILSGNFQRLEQVVINLIQNACQALTDVSQGIRVSTYYDDEHSQVVIAVEDEGTGIPKELLKQITDPFFTTKRDSGGTGLGLSISSNIVHNHGGMLEFESEAGQGTTARIRFHAASPKPSHEERKEIAHA